MAPKNKTPDVAAPADVPATPEVPAVDNGVKPPPYDAVWINVAMAAKLAEVTTQTVRNAYREHSAFTPNDKPAYFTTKMVDAFGNATDYDVVYLDKAAVEAWITARAEKASSGGNIGGKHGGAKRRVIRVTDEQLAAQPKMTVDGVDVPAVALADGTLIAIETPTNKAKAPAETPATSNGNGVEITTADGPVNDGGATLFDVVLEETPA